MFVEQVTTEIYLGSLLYFIGTVGVMLAIIAFCMIDFGSVRARNALDTVVQKIGASMIAIGAFMAVGFAIWVWQYNQAFAVPNALGQALSDWWIGGAFVTAPAIAIDPALAPGVDQFQIFVVFIAAYAGVLISLIHSAALERLKAGALYVMAVVTGGLVLPVLLYLTWGSVSPLTKYGLHDFVGIFGGYICAGVWSLVLLWRLGPRLGTTTPAADIEPVAPHNPGILAIGVGLLIVAIPMFAMGCGFLIPGTGYIGISGTTSGFGLVLVNYFAALVGGAASGLVLAYATRVPSWVLLGPIAGYISCSALLDVATPLAAAAVGFLGTFVAYAVARAMAALRLDEQKIVPLGLGCGVFGAVAAGVVGWGQKTGGYPGLEGEFAFQAATITPWNQVVGVAITIGITATAALITVLVIEKTIGLRVAEADERAGLDASYWSPRKP